jgi:hypothetical protein
MEVDPNQSPGFRERLREPPDVRNRRSGTALNDDQWVTTRVNPAFEARELLFMSILVPTSVIEHEDVRASHGTAALARRKSPLGAHGGFIDDDRHRWCSPYTLPAVCAALLELKGTVALDNSLRGKDCLLEVAIYVRGKDEGPSRAALAPASEDLKASMWLC